MPAAPSDDERVCPVCGPLDGKAARLDEEFAPGIFAPPGHPNCRCTTLAPTELDGVEVRKYPGQPRDEKGRFAPGRQPQELPSGAYRAGTIDPSKVKAVADVDTDQVVLTRERARHIMRRHPGTLEKYGPSVPSVLADPDVIAVREGEGRMAHYFKRNVLGEGLDLELLVLLHTKEDRPGYVNSVWTMFETHMEHRLKGLEVVYARPRR